MIDPSRWLLWADRGKLARSMGENFRGEHAQFDIVDVWLCLAVVTIAAVVALLVSKFLARRGRDQRTYSPQGLFQQLCQAHRLDRADCKTLWRLAVQEDLEHPARLFLEPERFNPSGTTNDAERAALTRIRDTLFGEGNASNRTAHEH